MADKPVEQRQAQLSSFWDNGPGPAGVMLPPTIGMVNHDKTKKQNPAYSLGQKLPTALVGTGPGPSHLIPAGMTAKGPAPKLEATIKSRTRLNENINVNTPGPAQYFPEINTNRRKAPQYSLAFRTPVIESGKSSPGPIYLLPSYLGPKVPNKPAASEVTIKGKGKTDDEVFRSPGPIYDIVSPNVTKSRAGEVTIKGRWKSLKSQASSGPGDYDVKDQQVRRNPPSFSMGIRHSPFAGVFRTECDKTENSLPDLDC